MGDPFYCCAVAAARAEMWNGPDAGRLQKLFEECPRVQPSGDVVDGDDEGRSGNQIKGMLPRWGGIWEDEGGGSKVPAAEAGPSLDSSGSDLF